MPAPLTFKIEDAPQGLLEHIASELADVEDDGFDIDITVTTPEGVPHPVKTTLGAVREEMRRRSSETPS